MNNNNFNSNNQNDKKINHIKYVKLRPVNIKRRKISSTLKKSPSNFKKYLLSTKKRKTTLTNEENEEDFYKYTEKIENSMNRYQMSYDKKDEDEDNSFDKYINKKDKQIIQKVHDLNNSYDNRVMTSKNKDCNIKIEINEMNYPNPLKSLGIIKHNRHIYNELSKNILNRQSESFSKQIEEIENYNMKFGKKMPKIHITDLLFKDPLNNPLGNIFNQKKEIKLPSLMQKGKKEELKLFSYFKYPVKDYPEGREQFSICIKNRDIIITGGISSYMKNLPIWSLDIIKLQWEKINQNFQIDNRYGHSALSLDNKLYIYGGKTKYSNSWVLNGLEIFSFINNTYSHNNETGIIPEKRRNHIAIFIGQQMFIHGGINENGNVLNDSFLLNVNQLRWSKCNIDKMCHCPKLFGHACSLVIPTIYLYNPKFNIYSIPENDNIKKKKIKEKGLYVFGGKSKEDGGLTNQLWILIIGKQPLEWIRPETKGKPPIPRYFHTMNFYERGNYLIIHGGRNDTLSDNCALNDTFLLNLENFEWMQVSLFSDLNNFVIPGRYGHQSIVFIDKLIILGGMNNNSYLGCSLFIINLDFSQSNKMKRSSIGELMNIQKKNNTESNNKIENSKKNLKSTKLNIDYIKLPKII